MSRSISHRDLFINRPFSASGSKVVLRDNQTMNRMAIRADRQARRSYGCLGASNQKDSAASPRRTSTSSVHLAQGCFKGIASDKTFGKPFHVRL